MLECTFHKQVVCGFHGYEGKSSFFSAFLQVFVFSKREQFKELSKYRTLAELKFVKLKYYHLKLKY